MKLDLPPGTWECPKCHSLFMATYLECAACGTIKPDNLGRMADLVTEPKKEKQTETEKRFNAEMLNGHGVFEPITFNLRNGHKYTPDFMDVLPTTFYEVKGDYKLPSYQRARLAFDQCVIEFPMFKFLWAELKEGKWCVK